MSHTPNITRMDDGAEMTLIERDELARLRAEFEALKKERRDSGAELETLTIKLMAFTIVWDTAVAKGIEMPSNFDVIDHHCGFVIDTYKEKARQIIAEYDRKMGK